VTTQSPLHINQSFNETAHCADGYFYLTIEHTKFQFDLGTVNKEPPLGATGATVKSYLFIKFTGIDQLIDVMLIDLFRYYSSMPLAVGFKCFIHYSH